MYSRYRKNENAIAGSNQEPFRPSITRISRWRTASVLRSATGVGDYDWSTTPIRSWANFLMGKNVSFTQSKLDITADLRQAELRGLCSGRLESETKSHLASRAFGIRSLVHHGMRMAI